MTNNVVTESPKSLSFKVSKECLVAVVLFIILPLYSTPLIIYGMWKQKSWAFILWALFMGLIGILVPPTGDFYRYAMDYEMYKGLEWSDFLFVALLQKDLMLPLLSFFIGELGLHFDLSRFLYNFIGYYLLGILYLDIIQNNLYLHRKKVALYALGFFVSFNLSIYCFRYFLSAIFFVYGAYQIVYKSKKLGWCFVGLAVFNHMSYVIHTAALILQQMHFFRFSRNLVIILIFLSFFLDSSLIIKTFTFLPVDFVSTYMIYLDGYWAQNFLEDQSWKLKMQMFVGNLIQYFCVLIYVAQYKNSGKKYTSLTNSMLLLATITTPFATINGRFLAVMTYFIKVHLLVAYDNTRKMFKYLVVMFWLTMLSNVMGLWGVRRQLAISDFPILFYSSFFHILNHTYDSNWIHQNVSGDGDLLQVNF